MKYYTRERLGPKQALTAEGYLLCEEVPIARTGQQTYATGEIPLAEGPDGLIIVDRFPEDVFHPDTINSFNGKDVVDEHPDEDVKTHNWRNLSVGVVMNARRGTGLLDDVLLADFLIKDESVIEAIRNGKREVSCGYDADYIQAVAADGVTPMPGRGKQINIFGNHVALVDAGRCGPRCAIGDTKGETMKLSDRIRAAFKAKDETALEAVLTEVPAEATATHVHVHTADSPTKDCKCKDCSGATVRDGGITKDAVVDAVFADKRFTDVADNVKRIADAFEKKDEDDEDEDEDKDDKDKAKDAENRMIEGNLEEEAPPGTSDGIAAKSRDSALLVDSFQETVSLAEIIAPGIHVPTVDAKADPKKTLDSIHRLRKSVLDLAAAQPELRGFMDETTNGRDYKTFDMAGTRSLFRSVGAHKKALNNAAATRSSDNRESRSSGNGTSTGINTPADLNARMKKFYGGSEAV